MKPFYATLALILLVACAEPTPPLVINTATPRPAVNPDDLRQAGSIPVQEDFPDVEAMNAIVDLPPNYEEGSALPVLLFLHDDGLQGTDISLIESVGRPRVLAENPTAYPFILLIPQLPGDYTWSDFPRTLQLALEIAHEQYPTDRDRVYIAGHGLGGYGVLDYARGLPRLFAGAVVSGGFYVGQANELCEVGVPIRLYHGTADTAVPLYSGERVSGALEDCGIAHTFTLLEGLDHAESADAVYENEATYDWLLQQER